MAINMIKEFNELNNIKAITQEINSGEYIEHKYLSYDDIYEVVEKIELERKAGMLKGSLSELLDNHYKNKN